ncbi:MAG TPA: quinol:electron acceptor oxidoreductase subunit ActD [Stellaceae bacterium]|nr:quinol:electron acceptor oxidoreductase subunit ActD [Stellaceae bacterium]
MSGLAAEFAAEAALVRAAGRLHRTGVRRIEAYTPYPVDPSTDSWRSRLISCRRRSSRRGPGRWLLLQWYGAAVSYSRNIGGRPLASWPAFIPIAFETAVLCSVLAGFVGFFRGGAAAGAVSADRCTARF